MVAAIVLTGCATFSEQKKHYLMLPVVPDTSPSRLDIVVGVGPVTLTDYLQRQNIVVRESSTRIHIAPNDRWAAPLDAHLSELLAKNLRQRLGLTEGIPTFPWPSSVRVDYQVTVHITRFIHYTDRVYLDANWRILDGPSSMTAEHLTQIEVPSGTDYDQVVDTMSRMVGRLSDEIAETIRQLSGNTVR
ncbi:MAG: membrane integrity-associated transporter subunit PqiC [Gammaproteobacteria bacterium]|nr:membrane integrity-associated transporter subunit PqiC [Gammaproteobacteria bacterium]